MPVTNCYRNRSAGRNRLHKKRACLATFLPKTAIGSIPDIYGVNLLIISPKRKSCVSFANSGAKAFKSSIAFCSLLFGMCISFSVV